MSKNVPDVLSAIEGRQSIRAFVDTPVPRETVSSILQAAACAPSGTNTQPWNVWVVAGNTRAQLCDEVCAYRDANPALEQDAGAMGEYQYYPNPVPEPYRSRRRAVGWKMYSAMGVEKGDRDASWKVAGRNYRFFGAPIGLIFTLERSLEKGSWIDLGIFLNTIMLAARHFGLDTCAQGAWARYHAIVRRHLQIPDNHIVVCGMALGKADTASPANVRTADKLAVDEFARFYFD